MFSRCFARELSSAVRKRSTAGKSNLTGDDKTGIALLLRQKRRKSFRSASARRTAEQEQTRWKRFRQASEAGQAL
jgi:hypothetical protein